MRGKNISAPLSLSTSVVPGSIFASMSGAVAGSRQAVDGLSHIAQQSQQSQANSLLNVLNWIERKAFHAEKAPALELFDEDLARMLGLTHNSAAAIVGRLILGPFFTAAHISQLPLDTRVSFQALLKSFETYQDFSHTKEASSIAEDQALAEGKNGLSANSKFLMENSSDRADVLYKEAGQPYKALGRPAASHGSTVKNGLLSSLTGILSTASSMALLTDIIGSTFREASAIKQSSQDESLSIQEKNVYAALRLCSQTLSESQDCRESLLALQKLEGALKNFEPVKAQLVKAGATGPSFSVFCRMLTSLPFVKTVEIASVSVLASMVAEGILSKEEEKFLLETRESAAKASLIQGFSEGVAGHHSQHLSDFSEHFDNAIAAIDLNLKDIEEGQLIASSAVGTIRSQSASLIATSLIPGLMGLLSRELSGTIDFFQQDRGSQDELHVVMQTRQEMTGADLDQWLTRVTELQARVRRCEALGVSAPVSMGALESSISGSLVTVINVLAGMYSALRELKHCAESPAPALQLDDEEKKKAANYSESAVDTNKKTANSSGTGAVSENLSLHRQLQTVMKNLVLIHRSYRNPLNGREDRKDLNATGRSLINTSQGNSTGFFLGAMAVTSLIGLETGLALEALFASSRYSREVKRLSDGVDKIVLTDGSKSNLSTASNASRLAEKSTTPSSLIQAASKLSYGLGESLSSRALTVALCHSGALKEMLRRMTAEEQEKLQPEPLIPDSILISDASKQRLEQNILDVLDAAERDQNPIPGLNADMASELAATSHASIASAISSHTAFIMPFLHAIVAAKKASVIDPLQRDEALPAESALARISSQALNIMKAFSKNSIAELTSRAYPLEHSPLANVSHDSSALSMAATCAASLLCEELFEILLSRSLTLLDKEKVQAESEACRNVSEKAAEGSWDGVRQDSVGGDSSSQRLLALRLTLSHLGHSLEEMASKLEANPDLLREDIPNHASQASMLEATVAVFSQCSKTLLSLSALLSQFPMTSAGSVEALRELIHKSDDALQLKPLHSSENCSRDCGSNSCLLTGIGTDCVSSILSTVSKLLFQASILGLDSSLSLAKILEISCIHPQPAQGFALESQRQSVPDGLSANIKAEKNAASIAATLGLAGSSLASGVAETQSSASLINHFQATIDQEINEVRLLADEEEAGLVDLKQFYFLLLQSLDPTAPLAQVRDLLERFHHGGINLSKFHSYYGGLTIEEKSAYKNSLLHDDRYRGCNTLSDLIQYFINKAFYEEKDKKGEITILDALKQMIIMQGRLSDKAAENWQFIVNAIFDRLKLDGRRAAVFSREPLQARLDLQDIDARQAALLQFSADESEVLKL